MYSPQVYQGSYKGKDVALKIFLEQETIRENSLEGMAAASKDIVEKMEKEVKIMAELDHPNIVKYLGYSKIPPCIMTELCPEGNLAQKLAKTLETDVPFSWKERIAIVRDMLVLYNTRELLLTLTHCETPTGIGHWRRSSVPSFAIHSAQRPEKSKHSSE